MKYLEQKAWHRGTSWGPRVADPGPDHTGYKISNLHRFSFVLGSRIASWLPSFSVEVMHTTNILGIAQASNSQLNAMVRAALWGG